MKATERNNILFVIPLVLALVAFWFLVLSPKQKEASDLEKQIGKVEREVEQQQLAVEAGRQARKDFPRDYHRLVVMGKAVPSEDETASLLVQIERLSVSSGVDFRSISGGAGDPATAVPAAPSTTSTVPATEGGTAAAGAGASVGAAGFTTLPYSLDFKGSYFEIADFLAGLDRLVDPTGKRIRSDGRLITVDHFTLSPEGRELTATLTVNTYLTQSAAATATTATGAAPATAPAASTGTTTSTATSTTATP
jgi:Tfp pilus assembly protein PilO